MLLEKQIKSERRGSVYDRIFFREATHSHTQPRFNQHNACIHSGVYIQEFILHPASMMGDKHMPSWKRAVTDRHLQKNLGTPETSGFGVIELWICGLHVY